MGASYVVALSSTAFLNLWKRVWRACQALLARFWSRTLLFQPAMLFHTLLSREAQALALRMGKET